MSERAIADLRWPVPVQGRHRDDTPGGDRAALVVATGRGEASARRLGAVLDDAGELAAVLADPSIGAFRVTSLTDCTTQDIRLGIEDFLAGRHSHDHVVVHVCGHAVLDPRHHLFFAGTDTRSDRLASTALDAEWLARRLAECPARRQIVILDTGNGGAFVDAATAGTVVDGTPPGSLRAVLASTGAERPAGPSRPWDGPALARSFTGYLAQGLRTGEADSDDDGLVSADDAYAYVHDRLSAVGGDRTPRRWTAGHGRLILCRSARGTVPAGAATVEPARPTVTLLGPAGPATRTPEPDLDVAHAIKVAQTLDPVQALAAVQGLDAAQVVDVAQVLEIGRPTPAAPPPGRADGTRRRQLEEVLVEDGVISTEQLALALTAQREAPGPRRSIGRVVVELGLTGEREVASCLARMLHLDVIDLSRVVPAPDAVRLLPRAVAERTLVLVIDRGPRGELVVAAADPTNVVAFDDVRLYTRSTDLKVLVATESQIRDQLHRAWSLESDTSQVAEIVQEVGVATEEGAERWQGTIDEDAPIVRLVTQILRDGVRSRASDIHIEVQRDTLRVRFRVDGLLRDVMEAPRRVATSVVSRVKIISGLDIAERRIPQDGRTRFTVEGAAIDARVSTLPSLHGEKVVIRLLARGDAVPSLPSLGLEPDQLRLLETALAVPQGLILITGPTGSGKTNTLYSAISQISSPELNIVTLEDPVEVQLPGITQVGVNEKTGMTFGRGLRSILRQDPDIILLGEVRDGETAQLALKAAMTGHMVLTTLHTNSAVAALTRLVDMGAEPFIIASSLTVSVAQRLVRRPCQACDAPYRPDDVTLTLLGLSAADLACATPRRGSGCPECGGTGYRGRTAVYEVLDVDGPMRQVLMKDPTEAAIAAQAQVAGMVTLRAAAVQKALQGTTTFEEAVRVTSR